MERNEFWCTGCARNLLISIQFFKTSICVSSSWKLINSRWEILSWKGRTEIRVLLWGLPSAVLPFREVIRQECHSRRSQEETFEGQRDTLDWLKQLQLDSLLPGWVILSCVQVAEFLSACSKDVTCRCRLGTGGITCHQQWARREQNSILRGPPHLPFILSLVCQLELSGGEEGGCPSE